MHEKSGIAPNSLGNLWFRKKICQKKLAVVSPYTMHKKKKKMIDFELCWAIHKLSKRLRYLLEAPSALRKEGFEALFAKHKPRPTKSGAIAEEHGRTQHIEPKD